MSNNTSSTRTPNIADCPDRLLLDELHRAVCKEIAGMKEQIQAKQAIRNALERRMGMEKQWGS